MGKQPRKFSERGAAAARHNLTLARRAVAPPSLSSIRPPIADTPCDKATRWLLPWSRDSYPGVEVAVREIGAGRIAWATFKAWRGGTRTMPEWFATLLADMIETRCRAGLAIVQELRDYRVPVRKPGGAMVVQADGRDRRGGRSGVMRDPSTGPEPGQQKGPETGA